MFLLLQSVWTYKSQGQVMSTSRNLEISGANVVPAGATVMGQLASQQRWKKICHLPEGLIRLGRSKVWRCFALAQMPNVRSPKVCGVTVNKRGCRQHSYILHTPAFAFLANPRSTAQCREAALQLIRRGLCKVEAFFWTHSSEHKWHKMFFLPKFPLANHMVPK